MVEVTGDQDCLRGQRDGWGYECSIRWLRRAS